MRLISKRLVRAISSLIILMTFLTMVLSCSSASNASYGVQSNDSWVFIVKKAKRYFEYSVGFFDFSSLTQGYRLGEKIVPEQEKIELTILPNNSTDLEITYQLKWGNASETANSSSTLFENGIQESLGRGVLGNGYDFLLSNSGVTIGDWVFIVPVDKLMSSPLQI